jgi:D-glycero-D-manno-heptose 1,7-bisphosphate phosphatase
MKCALFLDRDGIIGVEKGYLWRYEDWEYHPAIFELMKVIQPYAIPVIVISNQGGVGKGLYTLSDVEALHSRIIQDFLACQLEPPIFYYCPHHESHSLCLCRKPLPLLFERALARFQLQASRCWMLGDQERDLIPAYYLGMHTVLIHPSNRSNFAHFTFPDLESFIPFFQRWLEFNEAPHFG